MLYLSIDGRPLLLPESTTAQVDHINPLFADGVEDGYSLPIEVPSRGNEAALEHTHQLPLRNRKRTFEKAQLGHMGVPLFPGTLHVLSSVEESVRMTFLVDGFVEEVKDQRLPTLLEGLVVDIIADGYYHFHNIPRYADGGPCQFPMFYNPSLYGDANPDWYPKSPKVYNDDEVYEMNDLVVFTEYDPIEKTYIWQCTADTTPGTRPVDDEDFWRRTAFGIVNAWDKENEAHYVNTISGNYHAQVPWFYLKWVLHKALASVGYTPVGSFMTDTTTDEVNLPNTTTIDKDNTIDSDNFFRARKTTPTFYDPSGGWNNFNVPGTDESPAPYTDTTGLWNNSAMTFSPSAAGVWKFRVTVTYNARRPSASRPYCQLYLINSAGTVLSSGVGVMGRLSETVTFNHSHVFGSGDVGQDFHLVATQRRRPNESGLWPAYDTDHYENADVSAWLQEAAPIISTPDTIIHPHRHVPDVTLMEFLIAIADAYNLQVTADTTSRTLRLDYKEGVLRDRISRTSYHDERLVNDTEIDDSRSMKAVELDWGFDPVDVDEDKLLSAALLVNPVDVNPPISTGLYAVVRSTRQLLASFFRDGDYHWKQIGYHVPTQQVGEGEPDKTIKPDCQPVHMTHVKLDGEDYQIPILDEVGTSAWYHTIGDRSKILLSEYAPMTSHSGDVTDVPGARSWGYGWTADELSGQTFLWSTEDEDLPGMFEKHHIRWLNMLVNAEPVTLDLLVDGPFLRGPDWKNVLHMQGQDYLVERLPVTYGTNEGPLLAEGVPAWRLLPSTARLSPGESTPFACVGPRYIAIQASGEFGVYMYSDDHFSLRLENGDVITAPSDTSTLATTPSACFWPSDEDGNISTESIRDIAIQGEITSVDASGFDGIEITGIFDVSESTLTSFVIPSVIAASVQVINNPDLTEVTLPATINYGGLYLNGNALTEASVNAVLANLRANGFIGTAQLDGGTNAAPTGQGIIDLAWLNSNGASVTTN